MKTLKQLTANLAAFKGLIDKVKDLTGLSPNMGASKDIKDSKDMDTSKDIGDGKDMGADKDMDESKDLARHVRSSEESEEEVVRS